MQTRNYDTVFVQNERLCEFVESPLELEEMKSHRADRHIICVDTTDRVLARCSLWFSATPPLAAKRTGFIGHFAAEEGQAAFTLLQQAITELQNQGCEIAVGPIDGSTWRKYRVVTDRGTTPSFFLEISTPSSYPGYFQAAGFAVLRKYFSAINTELPASPADTKEIEKRLAKKGLVLRHFNMAESTRDLKKIYELSRQAFAGNVLYSDISESEFLSSYAKLFPYVDERLISMVEREDQLVAFAFALPNILCPNKSSVVLKTVARSPHPEFAGIGFMLGEYTHLRSKSFGFKGVIHAFMLESSRSLAISANTARRIREYSLYCRELRL